MHPMSLKCHAAQSYAGKEKNPAVANAFVVAIVRFERNIEEKDKNRSVLCTIERVHHCFPSTSVSWNYISLFGIDWNC